MFHDVQMQHGVFFQTRVLFLPHARKTEATFFYRNGLFFCPSTEGLHNALYASKKRREYLPRPNTQFFQRRYVYGNNLRDAGARGPGHAQNRGCQYIASRNPMPPNQSPDPRSKRYTKHCPKRLDNFNQKRLAM